MRELIIKLTAGRNSPERCLQGLTVASAAVAAGAQVSLWLTGESAWLAAGSGEVALAESPPASELLRGLLGTAAVTVCTQCAARRGIGPADLLPHIAIAGATSFVEEVLRPGVQALVY